MTLSSAIRERRRGVRLTLAVLLALSIATGAYLVWPTHGGNKITGYFTSAVGLYPGDQIRIVGVPVGKIESIEPRADDVKITMTVKHGVKVPADARAIIMSPNLVAARFIQLAPAYTNGPALSDGASIPLAKTAVPVEWDEVKESLTDLAKQLSPAAGQLQGPLGKAINQAADTFNGNGDSFRSSLRELSQAAGRLGDSRTDIFGTVKNLQVLVDALSQSNEQIVSFAGHVASVSQVLAKSSTHLDHTLGSLNQALIDVKGFLQQNNSTLIGTVNKLTDLTQVLSDQSEDIEQVLHVAGPGIANFYNIYDPAQGTLNGLISVPEFANPVQFICGGSFDTAAGISGPEYYKRAEICRERLGPPLRRLTFNYPPIMFHPLNSITAYKGQIIYDSPATQTKSQTPIPDLHWIPAPGAHPPSSTDLQALMIPQSAPNGAASVPGAPAQANSPFGPRPGPGPAAPVAPARPGPLPAEQGAGR
ncbi:virulence factor Mce family protein [Candidatus Mycobacterium wuenschmannii]|uniref:Virulence factor Mce family protein n=1 Tax=Candidatus Mycobacterium wuenschmannii TaxID=3027808 RepID=A0ABY8VRI4_9MYCO|nr:virulence factor Mce family protein [Candidatus Mycobacterium wuenschmannii]WIM86253.1 virulence factor Mce family protein [Candidatus Mycobacterium wuenschmannii]